MKRTIAASVVLAAAGVAVFVLGSHYFDAFPTNRSLLYNAAITLALLAAAALLRRNPSTADYAPAAYALFTASAALLFLGTGVLNLHDPSMPDLQYLGLDKLSQALHVVPVIVGLTLLAKRDLGSVFLQRGRLKQGLVFGLGSFAVFAVAAYLLTTAIEGSVPLFSVGTLWVILYVFANGLMEELWFRGVFLRSYEAVIGRTATILVTALVFGVSHVYAEYYFPGGGLALGAVTFAFGVVAAYSMFKTDSLIGAVLFHAGYDLLIILPVLATV